MLKPNGKTEMLPYIVPNRPVNVVVAVPCGDTIRSRTSASITSMCSFTVMHGPIQVALLSYEGSMIARTRNGIVDTALKLNFEYVLQIDSDMTFPPETLLRLLSHGKDVVGAIYNKRLPPHETLGKLLCPEGRKPEEANNGGLWPAAMLPGGLMMVKTDVYRKLPWPWYFESYQRCGDPIEAWRQSTTDHAPMPPPPDALDEVVANSPKFVAWLRENAAYQEQTNVARDMTGEDYGFCRKAARAGIPMWADLDLSFKVTHLGTQAVSCNPQSALTP